MGLIHVRIWSCGNLSGKGANAWYWERGKSACESCEGAGVPHADMVPRASMSSRCAKTFIGTV